MEGVGLCLDGGLDDRRFTLSRGRLLLCRPTTGKESDVIEAYTGEECLMLMRSALGKIPRCL